MAEEQRPGRTALSPLAAALVRRRQRPRRGAVASALLLHVLLVLLFWAGGRRLSAEMPEFRAYRVNLVSPPPQEQGEPQPVVETPQIITPPPAEATPPAPAPTPPAPEPARTPPQQPPPRPAQQTPPRQTPPAQTPPRTPPAQTPPAQTPPRTPPAQTPPRTETPPVRQPTPTTGNNPQPVQVGGDGVNVRQDGQDFPFPAYLNNVVQQIHNHFRWSGAPNLEAQVTFFILRDGSVGGIQVTRRSGNLSFDLEATGAIEQVAARGRFGALPDGWQQDRLWVSFRFLPPR